jgi:hypothetical protein
MARGRSFSSDVLVVLRFGHRGFGEEEEMQRLGWVGGSIIAGE